MSHHGSTPPDFDDDDDRQRQDRAERLRALLDTASFRGALGDFPLGKLTPQDEGAIQFAVGDKDGKVTLDFGTPVHWLAMSPQEAADLASTLIKRARLAARKAGETIGFTI